MRRADDTVITPAANELKVAHASFRRKYVVLWRSVDFEYVDQRINSDASSIARRSGMRGSIRKIDGDTRQGKQILRSRMSISIEYVVAAHSLEFVEGASRSVKQICRRKGI